MSVGGWNPIPCVVGGAPSPMRSVYLGLRSAMGGDQGKAVGPSVADGGIEDAWRYAKALGIARARSVTEQAAIEFFPHRATYGLHEWEEILRLPQQDVPEASRKAIAAVVTAQALGDLPHIRARLRAEFASSIDVTVPSRTLQAIAALHKTLADRTGVVAYGPRRSSVAPGFSSAYVIRVTWPVAALTQEQILLVRRVLATQLPSWVNYEIVTGSGFICGVSLLGQVGV
jgi:hypothetical protein